MATSLIRFQVVLPNVDTGSTDDNAILAFRRNMESITTKLFFMTAYKYDANDNLTQRIILYGDITNTVASQNTALGYLTTLNNSLSPGSSPVDCEVWTVTSEP